jgi:hypothetical protein
MMQTMNEDMIERLAKEISKAWFDQTPLADPLDTGRELGSRAAAADALPPAANTQKESLSGRKPERGR